jgi:YHS domain-containing protein
MNWSPRSFLRTGVLAFAVAFASAAHAQQPPKPPFDSAASNLAQGRPEQHEHGKQAKPAAPAEGQVHDHTQMPAGQHGAAREGSGTAWLPDASLMYAIHGQRGPWELMAHGNAFVQYLDDAGPRGSDQFGSINWIMGMAHRNIGKGRLRLHTMLSFEPATIGGCGYPDLLATGELCDGEPIHDRQHQHDLFMEVAASYDRPLAGAVRWQVYGGPAAEPALGPVAYPHRLSAMPNLLAPITHHWLDSTHISFGVVTGGVYGNRWKAEASIFNGREPDEQRTGFDLAPLDSVAGRVWFLPTANVAIQVSAGRLTEAEPGEDGGPRIDVTRATASVTYHRLLGEGGIWASTAAWGRNVESGEGTNAFLLETNLTLEDRDAWYGRFETVDKSAHDLDLPGSLVHDVEREEVFIVSKLQGGYTRYLPAWRGLKPGLGLSASAGFVPSALESVYGSRVNVGFGVFFNIRPAVMRMAMTAPASGATAPPAPSPGHEHAAPATPVPAPRAAEPAAKPPATTDPHAEHAAPPAKPVAKPPEAAPKPTPSKPAAKPAAPDPHAGHAMPPSKPAPPAKKGAATKPTAAAKPPAAAAAKAAPATKPPPDAIDPVCGLKVDHETAPKATVNGRTYYFCSEQHQQLFQKNPAKYLPKVK